LTIEFQEIIKHINLSRSVQSKKRILLDYLVNLKVFIEGKGNKNGNYDFIDLSVLCISLYAGHFFLPLHENEASVNNTSTTKITILLIPI
jgi:hypothetical protein